MQRINKKLIYHILSTPIRLKTIGNDNIIPKISKLIQNNNQIFKFSSVITSNNKSSVYNFYNNVEAYNIKRYYCNKTNGSTPAEVDIHNEDDVNNEFKAVIDSQGQRVEPKYYIEFTCTYVEPGESKECGHVSKKTFSKHSYHKGVVLIKCDGCKKIHLIADHLGYTGFQNQGKTIEDFMAAKGIPVQRYKLDKELTVDGDDDNQSTTTTTTTNNKSDINKLL
ncbi:Zim17-type zinc finger-containing protein [Tieghemostelium lacteum]|uniref:Zim17-type zinc finger-containing protein n=1 Tax=Tieghemostelium lacteum TaxID=361077 RepID=A0A151ZHT7_TIELA|nr:Zim17-type zinc finger-containing protein [Tieghemostelium lacteum]|eukprot:KYQ93536.1 Zim17-type zinc finger-containing protein [Tieghemostelium lacteum]